MDDTTGVIQVGEPYYYPETRIPIYCTRCGTKLVLRREVVSYNAFTGEPNWYSMRMCMNQKCDHSFRTI